MGSGWSSSQALAEGQSEIPVDHDAQDQDDYENEGEARTVNPSQADDGAERDTEADADTAKTNSLPSDSNVTFVAPPEFPENGMAEAVPESPGDRSAEEQERILRANAEDLSREDLLWRLEHSETKTSTQTRVVRDFVVSLGLGPDMSRWYADLLRDLLRRVLLGLDLVHYIEYIECSFPSVPKEIPQLDLVRAGEGSLAYSEWDITWSPGSWWIAASIIGRQLGPLTAAFSVVATVSSFKVVTRARIACSRDCSALRIGFVGQPLIELGVGTKAGIGSIPVPIQDRIETALRTEIGRFINNNLMGKASMVIPLRRRKKIRLNDDDVRVAEEAARRAAQYRST